MANARCGIVAGPWPGKRHPSRTGLGVAQSLAETRQLRRWWDKHALAGRMSALAVFHGNQWVGGYPMLSANGETAQASQEKGRVRKPHKCVHASGQTTYGYYCSCEESEVS